jgi:hypothetical protein
MRLNAENAICCITLDTLHVSKDTVKRIYACTENNARQSIMFREYSIYIQFSIKYENV